LGALKMQDIENAGHEIARHAKAKQKTSSEEQTSESE